jgi:hypothetical protein
MYRANSTSMEETIKALDVANEFLKITHEIFTNNIV